MQKTFVNGKSGSGDTGVCEMEFTGQGWHKTNHPRNPTFLPHRELVCQLLNSITLVAKQRYFTKETRTGLEIIVVLLGIGTMEIIMESVWEQWI